MMNVVAEAKAMAGSTENSAEEEHERQMVRVDYNKDRSGSRASLANQDQRMAS